MHIVAIKPIPIIWECKPVSDALSTSKTRKALLVKITTDRGLTGMGEAFLYGCSLSGATRMLSEQFSPLLVNEDPLHIDDLWQKMFWNSIACGRRGIILGLMSGIDIALWDIKAQADGVPVAKALGTGIHSDRIASYASGGFYAPAKGLDGLQAETESYLEKGYQAMKMKVGRNPGRADSPLRYMANQENGVSEEEDLRRIAMVRSTLGPDKPLMIDANASYSAKTVISLIPQWEKLGVSWVEEPLRFEDHQGLSDVRKAMRPPLQIAGFETEQQEENFASLLRDGCVDVVQADIGWAGGFTGTLKIAKLAEAYGKKFSLHSFGSAVHFAASLHLASALPNTEMIESEENVNKLRSGISQPFLTDETMHFFVPDTPGLGMQWNWNAIESLGVAQ